MYTTNIIEGLNRQYRKVTKTKSVFPSDTALEKMLYLACENVAKKWTQRYRNWDQVLNQLIVLYGERLTQYLSKKARAAITKSAGRPSFIPSAFTGLPEKPNLIPEAGCTQRAGPGQSPQKSNPKNALF